MKLLVLAAIVAIVAAEEKLVVPNTSYGVPDDTIKGSGTNANQFVQTVSASPNSASGIQQLPLSAGSSFSSSSLGSVNPSQLSNINLGNVGNVHYAIDASSLSGIDPAQLAGLTLDLSSVGLQDANLKKLNGISLGSLASLQGAGLQGALQGNGFQGNFQSSGIQSNFQSNLQGGNLAAANLAYNSGAADYQQNIESGQELSSVQEQSDSDGGEVDKHLYFYTAPEEPEPAAPRVILPPKPKKNVKVIFVKAPAFKTAPAPIIQPQSLQHGEDKTVVYVLVKKPEEAAPIVLPTPPPTQPSKPEVVFIKYKDQKDAEEAVSHIQSTGSAQGLESEVNGVNGVSANSLAGQSQFLNNLNPQGSLNFINERNGFSESSGGPALLSAGGLSGLSGGGIQSVTNGPLLSSFGGAVTQNPLEVSSLSSLNLGGISSNNGLSGLNVFNNDLGGNYGGNFNTFSSTTLSPLFQNNGFKSFGFGSSTPSTFGGFSTTGRPGTLFDSFGSPSKRSFSFSSKNAPHSVYGPPKRSLKKN